MIKKKQNKNKQKQNPKADSNFDGTKLTKLVSVIIMIINKQF